MVMSEAQATEAAREVLKVRTAEMERLDAIHAYMRGRQRHPIAPPGLPQEVHRLTRMSRVNIMKIVVSAVAQTLYVDGYRAPRAADDAPAWDVWQANKMDARQIGVHRAALAYGTAYATVLPGDSAPVIRGYSPRMMTAVYADDDDDWPVWALRSLPGRRWKLYDESAVYTFEAESSESDALRLIETQEHSAGTTPVIRFLNEVDLDEDHDGEVEPLMALQDQIDLTTFDLLVAEHYQAFRQRWIIGWTAASENEMLKTNAARVWTFDDDPETVKVGEFEQTELTGYLESREASLRHAATISQTPVHELIGQLVNLSAEALVAAEAGQRRKVVERQMGFGESWEQVLELAGVIGAFETSIDAQVRWRDTESRALAQTVDALGKMATMLGIPPQELWERIPGVSQQDVERWRATFEQSDALRSLSDLLERQAGGEEPAGLPEAAA